MNAIHRILALLLLLAGAAAWAQPAPTDTKPVDVDRVVAIVNSDVVTANELKMRERSVVEQLRRQNIEVPPPDILARQVLERLVMDRALVQNARDEGLRVDDAQLDRALARMAEQNHVTPAQMREQVERDGTTWSQFREDIRNEMLITRLREREVDSKIHISDADVDAYLAEQASAKVAPPQLNIAQILLRVPEGATAQEIERQRLRAEEIRRQLLQGADFARLAAAFSDGPEAMKGGVIGLRSADRLPTLFVDAVAKLQPGQVSQVLRSPNGFHVLKLLERHSSGFASLVNTPIVQTHARHILIRVDELMPEAEARRRLMDIRERILSGQATFEEMARQYSSDGTASRGGDLGWVYPGDTVPDFQRAMDALKPGEISMPVKTQFGLHLIEVLARRTDKASPERVRAAARAALRERRIAEAVQDWLRQVRDRTYVKYVDR